MKETIARLTALDVLEDIGKGRKRNVSKSAIKHGAAIKYAYSGNIQKTKEYKAIIDTALDKMQRIREKMLTSLEKKDTDEEDTRTLVQSQSTLTHDIQLLSGGKTENVGVEEDRRILLGIVAQLRGSEDKMLE